MTLARRGAIVLLSVGMSAETPDRHYVYPVRKVKTATPEYTEEARKARIEGSVSVSVIITEKGIVDNIRVTRGLGYGLDKKAVECVRKWRFEPAVRDGEAVPTKTNIEINFRLL